MAIGNHYIIKVFSTYLAQQLLNVYAYELNSGTVTAADVALAFETQVQTSVMGAIVGGTTIDNIQVYNLEVPDDFAIISSALSGLSSGDGMPPYVSMSILYRRASRAVRNGHKRLGGVSEAHQSQGVLDSATIAILNDFALASATPLIGTSPAFTATPKIWRRARLHPTVFTDTFFDIASAVVNENLTTQNTRKFGRGA